MVVEAYNTDLGFPVNLRLRVCGSAGAKRRRLDILVVRITIPDVW